MIVRTGTPGANRFAGAGNEPFEFHGLGGNDTYLLRLFDIAIPQPHGEPTRIVYLRDHAVEAANRGTDTVNLVNHYDAVGFTGIYPTGSVGAAELANIEIINALGTVRMVRGVQTILPWSITAGANNNTITGAGGADSLNGGAGNDILRGGGGNDTLTGGPGIDKMYGGAGNDTYRIDSGADLASEAGGGGIDRILSTVSVNMGFAARVAGPVENLTLLGAAPIFGMGNGWSNTIVGNAAANILYGMAGNDSLNGGAGADRMFGGAGNDAYYVDNGADLASEAGGSGIDRILSTVSINLGTAARAAGAVENVSLLGTTALSVIGNALGNTIIGNAGANVIYGMGGNDILNGGVGSDRMFGGAGNDTYYVGSVGDLVNEVVAGSGGIDRVVSTISFILPYSPAGAVENLSLAGTAAINGTGNFIANFIAGNGSDNLLNGREGNDTLTGGLGDDAFVFDTSLSAVTNLDTITDFSNRGDDDSFRLDHDIFTQLPLGFRDAPRGLSSNQFLVLGTRAADTDDFVVYNDQTGALFYDADGNGAGAAIQFATLSNKPTLTAGEFLVV